VILISNKIEFELNATLETIPIQFSKSDSVEINCIHFVMNTNTQFEITSALTFVNVDEM
jgi:hypothetical protein